MKHLYLIRHAKSSWADDGLRDHERPLNNRGLKQLEPMGRAIRAEGALDGTVYCSNAARARQTLEGLIPSNLHHTVNLAPVLYTFNHEVVLDWLRDRSEDSITLIGHNPALEDLACLLLKHAPDAFPTCSCMHIALPIEHWHEIGKNKGRLEKLLTPNDVSYEQFHRKRTKIHIDEHLPLPGHIPESLLHQYQRIRDLEPGVLQGYDDEFLHQYRIAIRRSRAIAEAVVDIRGDGDLRKAVEVLKWHGQATSRLRDLHVLLGDLAQWSLEEDTQLALVSSGARSHFANLADVEHQELTKRLNSRQYRKDMDGWYQRLTSRHLTKVTRKLATEDIRRALEKHIHKHNDVARQLNEQSPDDHFHDLRKRLKRIRYLAELDKPAFHDMLRQLKHRQQRFGDFQDLHVQIDMLSDFRDSIATEPDMLAPVAGLNTLIANLAEEKNRRRDDILTLGGIG
ncbi:CHAD domain-containing protein [Marinobacter sp.]|jgi:phosphohistidine phosphatase|uniref:CHAD domain-containing protein n=1 Tax=Marinobacter sp. TaxID=50741 RepID=UPI002633EF08|nr:CHAD domain-containing protein [Marinobacter sp.]